MLVAVFAAMDTEVVAAWCALIQAAAMPAAPGSSVRSDGRAARRTGCRRRQLYRGDRFAQTYRRSAAELVAAPRHRQSARHAGPVSYGSPHSEAGRADRGSYRCRSTRVYRALRPDCARPRGAISLHQGNALVLRDRGARRPARIGPNGSSRRCAQPPASTRATRTQ